MDPRDHVTGKNCKSILLLFFWLKNVVVHLLKFNPNYTHIHSTMILFTNALYRSYIIELGGDAEGTKLSKGMESIATSFPVVNFGN